MHVKACFFHLASHSIQGGVVGVKRIGLISNRLEDTCDGSYCLRALARDLCESMIQLRIIEFNRTNKFEIKGKEQVRW